MPHQKVDSSGPLRCSAVQTARILRHTFENSRTLKGLFHTRACFGNRTQLCDYHSNFLAMMWRARPLWNNKPNPDKTRRQTELSSELGVIWNPLWSSSVCPLWISCSQSILRWLLIITSTTRYLSEVTLRDISKNGVVAFSGIWWKVRAYIKKLVRIGSWKPGYLDIPAFILKGLVSLCPNFPKGGAAATRCS